MPSINTHEVIDRHNRPQVDQRVMLRTFFINDGKFQDPYAVSSVHVFKRAQNLSPANVLNTNGLVASSQTSGAAMVFGVTGTGVVGTDLSLNEGVYTQTFNDPDVDPTLDACIGISGIYKLPGTGEFACVLDGQIGGDLSGVDGNNNAIQNTASGSMRYIDIWTVQLAQGSSWKTFINHFELFEDTFLAVTEPLLLRSKNKLYNKQVILGSKVDMKIGTEITIENANIDESIKNIFKDSVITNATVTIKKQNEDQNLPSRVTVVSSTTVDITSDNTLIYTFDTGTDLTSGNPTSLNVSELGSKSGTYSLQVEYTMLSEKIVSPLMYFIVK